MAKKHGTYHLYIHNMYIYIWVYIHNPRVFRNILPNPNCCNFRNKNGRFQTGGLLAQHVLVEATCKPCLAAQGEPRRWSEDSHPEKAGKFWRMGGTDPKCHTSFPAYETSPAPEAVAQQDKTPIFYEAILMSDQDVITLEYLEFFRASTWLKY